MARDASYLSQQVNGIIGQLHGLFDEIGVTSREREKREEELFDALAAALNNQVRLVTEERQGLEEEARRLIVAIRQMEASLEDKRARRDNEDELQVTYPLSRCLQGLQERHAQASKQHRERFEQVKKLVDALESYSSHLESSFVRIPLPPTGPGETVPLSFDLSSAYVDQLDAEFTRVYDEYTRRVGLVQAVAEEIIQMWAELGTPQAQTDAGIVKYYRDSPEQLGLHEEDVARLRARRDKLVNEKKNREKRLNDLRAAIEDLWGKLGVEEAEQKAFAGGNRGCGMRQINEWEDELARLQELKRQHLPAFVEEARCRLQELWDMLFLSEDEMLAFTPAFSDVYSDALLEAHEREIARLEALHEQRAPTLALVERHQTLVKEREELAASSQDASRLMMRGQKGEKRDPGKLLREEKMRKRIAKELPKVTAELRKVLEAWEDEYGRPFLVHGKRYMEELEDASPGVPTGSLRKTASMRSTVAPTIKRTPSTISVKTARPLSQTDMKTPVVVTPAATATRRLQASTMTRSVAAAAAAMTASRLGSPTRIPGAAGHGASHARAPLGMLKFGGNSPERPGGDARGSLRVAPVLMRAPPPKMRDLLALRPELDTPVQVSGFRSVMGHVRPVEAEDVYEDHSCSSRSQSQQSQSSRDDCRVVLSQSVRPGYGCPPGYPAGYPKPRVELRNLSDTSTAVSGSENWETYEDNSEPEPDASETYYAKVRAARSRRAAEAKAKDGEWTDEDAF